jgi:hypothetical protein
MVLGNKHTSLSGVYPGGGHLKQFMGFRSGWSCNQVGLFTYSVILAYIGMTECMVTVHDCQFTGAKEIILQAGRTSFHAGYQRRTTGILYRFRSMLRPQSKAKQTTEHNIASTVIRILLCFCTYLLDKSIIAKPQYHISAYHLNVTIIEHTRFLHFRVRSSPKYASVPISASTTSSSSSL